MRSLSVVLIDIDFFKLYNDRYGHVAGDECLSRAAEAMMQCLLDICGDLYRYGGEEFAVVLPDYDAVNAHAVGERLRAAVAALQIPHESNNGGVVTISVGVATLQKNLASMSLFNIAEHLVAEADKMLYVAKSSGRNTVRSLGV